MTHHRTHYVKTTSSTKPEVHNTATPPEEDRATAIISMHKIWWSSRGFRDMGADRHKQTDTLIAMFRTPLGSNDWLEGVACVNVVECREGEELQGRSEWVSSQWFVVVVVVLTFCRSTDWRTTAESHRAALMQPPHVVHRSLTRTQSTRTCTVQCTHTLGSHIHLTSVKTALLATNIRIHALVFLRQNQTDEA